MPLLHDIICWVGCNYHNLWLSSTILLASLLFSTRLVSCLWKLWPNTELLTTTANGLFNRPGVAGAVLQTYSYLINNWVFCVFCGKSSKHLHSQVNRARNLKFGQNFKFSPLVTYHMSCVMRHLSYVTCHKKSIANRNVLILFDRNRFF